MLSYRMTTEGRFLFRYRSYLPLILLLPFLWQLSSFHYLGDSAAVDYYWLVFCLVISAAGLGVRISTVGFVPVGTSGRNTKTQIAHCLNTSGWYSVCRNPLYLGNYIIGLGFAATLHDPVLVMAYTASLWLYYERIIAAEESFLAEEFGQEYRDWANRTPVIFPAFHLWEKPAMNFCWRTALRREYSAILLIPLVFFLVNMAEHYRIERRVTVDRGFAGILLVSAVVYVTLRTLKKHTRMLDVAGRS